MRSPFLSLARRRPPTPAAITPLPRHVGVVMDGNRRWAQAAGLTARAGHRAGAQHVRQLLGWCADWGIDHVSVYVLSADNIRKRSGAEVDHLFELLTTTLPDLVDECGDWALHATGDLELVPEAARAAIDRVAERTRDRPRHVTMAIGYDGRTDILRAVRTVLRSGADVDVDTISRSFGGGPVTEIDLVVRTGSEARLSGFFPWQTARAELFLSPTMWPSFTASDFESALRHFAAVRSGD